MIPRRALVIAAAISLAPWVLVAVVAGVFVAGFAAWGRDARTEVVRCR